MCERVCVCERVCESVFPGLAHSPPPLCHPLPSPFFHVRVAEKGAINKMHLNNLAIVFGPVS